jgi:hypothetical protein
MTPLGGGSQGCIVRWRSSVDGYIRLRQHDLNAIDLIHVCTLRDDALLIDIPCSAISAGLTEWVGKLGGCAASITLGWDWYRDLDGRIRFAGSDIRSNLMLTGASGTDFGVSQTGLALRRWLGDSEWTQVIATAANKFLN